MAIFLLIYIIICLVWFFWAGILTYLILRYRFPDKSGMVHLIIFWAASAVILLVSIILISKADWAAVPEIFKSVSVN